MSTPCCGYSKDVEPLLPLAEPCRNRPLGSTVTKGQVGQSRITEPGSGAAGGDTGTGRDAGEGAVSVCVGRCPKNQARRTRRAAPLPQTAYLRQAPRGGGAVNCSINSRMVAVRSRRSNRSALRTAAYCPDVSPGRCGGGRPETSASSSSKGWMPVNSWYARHAKAYTSSAGSGNCRAIT